MPVLVPFTILRARPGSSLGARLLRAHGIPCNELGQKAATLSTLRRQTALLRYRVTWIHINEIWIEPHGERRGKFTTHYPTGRSPNLSIGLHSTTVPWLSQPANQHQNSNQDPHPTTIYPTPVTLSVCWGTYTRSWNLSAYSLNRNREGRRAGVLATLLLHTYSALSLLPMVGRLKKDLGFTPSTTRTSTPRTTRTYFPSYSSLRPLEHFQDNQALIV